MTCRICLEESGVLISVCDCLGTCKFVHRTCVETWKNISHKTHCELCQARFNIPSDNAFPSQTYMNYKEQINQGGIDGILNWLYDDTLTMYEQNALAKQSKERLKLEMY